MLNIQKVFPLQHNIMNLLKLHHQDTFLNTIHSFSSRQSHIKLPQFCNPKDVCLLYITQFFITLMGSKQTGLAALLSPHLSSLCFTYSCARAMASSFLLAQKKTTNKQTKNNVSQNTTQWCSLLQENQQQYFGCDVAQHDAEIGPSNLVLSTNTKDSLLHKPWPLIHTIPILNTFSTHLLLLVGLLSVEQKIPYRRHPEEEGFHF